VDANHGLIAKKLEEEVDNNVKSTMEYKLQKMALLLFSFLKKPLSNKYYQTWLKRQNKHMSY
jgi:5,10-methylene-tetrahydrofolate dehydrogenase/methenyl tetrahydrofolate cyclohydrolase